jgi:hypothetical protein
MLDKVREIRDEIEQKIKGWLEHPEEELEKLKEERECERRERLEARTGEVHAGRPFPRSDAPGTARAVGHLRSVY